MTNRSENASTDHAKLLRVEVQTAIINAARTTGWAKLNRPALVTAFRGRVGRSTIYRWIDALIDTPLERSCTEIIRDSRGSSPGQVQSVAREIRERAAGLLPSVPTIEECAAVVVPLRVMEKIQLCLDAAQDVMIKSRNVDGTVRNGKMLLLAAESLRRSLDTAVKLQAAIEDGLQIERFHRTIMEEISLIDPDVARRIVAKLTALSNVWAPS